MIKIFHQKKPLNSINQFNTEKASLLSLPLSLFVRIGEFLPPNNVFRFARLSRYCLDSVASHLNLEFSLEDRALTEEDFTNRFGENGIYKEARCLNLSGSDFSPELLRLLPKTLKTVKLRNINTQGFRKYGFTDALTMRITILRVLGETLPHLKFLDISENEIGHKGARQIAEILRDLKDLNGLNISRIGIRGQGFHILEHLKSLTSLDISVNWIGDEGARSLTQLNNLKRLGIGMNPIGKRLVQILRVLLPVWERKF